MQYRVEVRLFLCTNAVAAHFTPRYGFEVHLIDQLVDGELVGQVRFVSKDQEWDPVEGGLVCQLVQFFSCHGQGRPVCSVHDITIRGQRSRSRDSTFVLTRSHLHPCNIAPTSAETAAVPQGPSCERVRICRGKLSGMHKPLESHMSLLDSLRIETDGWDRADIASS